MTANVRLELTVDAASVLAPTLIDGISQGVARSETACSTFDHSRFPTLRPSFVRVATRLALEGMELPSGWTVGGNPRLSSQLELVSDRVRIKVLKERQRLYPGGTLPAGRNEARRGFFSDTPLEAHYQPSLFEEFGPEQSSVNLLLLWDYVDANDTMQGATLRLVHPIGPGVYGRSVPIDLSIPIIADAAFYERRPFSPDNSPVDYFAAIAMEDNASDAR